MKMIREICWRVSAVWRVLRGRGGSSSKILCPWHTERAPSCHVKFGPNGWVHCFGCGHVATLDDLVRQLAGSGRAATLKIVLQKIADDGWHRCSMTP